MDFEPSLEQRDMGKLVGEVLAPAARQAAWDAPDAARVARSTYAQLAELDLLCAGIPERWGGVGGGVLDTTIIAREIGRAGLALPYVSAIPIAAAAIARFGDDDQRGRLLPAILAGETIPSAAIPTLDGGDRLALTGRRGDARLDGELRHVPDGDLADTTLAVWHGGDGSGLVLLDPATPAFDRQLVELTDHTRESRLHLRSHPVDAGALLEADGDPAGWLRGRAIAASCGIQLGLCETALRLAAGHVNERRQFGRRLSEFQAVAQRLADAFISLQAMQVATWRLVAALDRDETSTVAALVAKTLTAESAPRIMRAAVHVHGGTGVDVSYPLARYVVMSKRHELWLGSAGEQLARLGDALAGLDDLEAVMLA